MSAAVRREERRLGRLIERALLVALSSAPACSAPEPAGAPLEEPDPASQEGAGETESAPPEDVGEAESALSSEAGSGSCAPKQYTPDPPDACGKFVHLACGLPAGISPVSNCYLWLNDCKKVCPGAYFNCHAVETQCKDGKIVPDAKGGVDIDCVTCAKGIGRVPAGLAPSTMKQGESAAGDYLAAAGFLEAASVLAFRRLGRELGGLDAPPELVSGARAAARDEVRHARLVGRLARRFGGRPARPRVEALPPRPLDEIARENAVEGCVRETFGALLAAYQAERAADPEVRAAMRSIAADEARHAALSWAVWRWAAGRLDEGARAGIAAQCRTAVEDLRREAEAPVPGELTTALGLPGPAEQQALWGVLEAELWRELAAA